MEKKHKIIILANEDPDDHYYWIKSCEKYSDILQYEIINLTHNDWLNNILNSNADYLLTRPPGLTAPFKQLYDERIYIISEILIYENKKMLSYWLQANNIPHPKTWTFYHKKEAITFLKNTNYPLVSKINIGASGRGVKIHNHFKDGLNYVDEIFSARGKTAKVGPNISKGNLAKRAFYYIQHPGQINKRIKKHISVSLDAQKDFAIFQEFVPHNFEWRVVRIGDSFFAHKKMVTKDKASGTLIKGYENPPLSILEFVKNITDKYELYSQCVDVFETQKDNYLVNEMQCMFGQSDPYQMLVDGIPGRYYKNGGSWIFEEGDFNKNKSFDLRVRYVLNVLEMNKYKSK